LGKHLVLQTAFNGIAGLEAARILVEHAGEDLDISSDFSAAGLLLLALELVALHEGDLVALDLGDLGEELIGRHEADHRQGANHRQRKLFHGETPEYLIIRCRGPMPRTLFTAKKLLVGLLATTLAAAAQDDLGNLP